MVERREDSPSEEVDMRQDSSALVQRDTAGQWNEVEESKMEYFDDEESSENEDYDPVAMVERVEEREARDSMVSGNHDSANVDGRWITSLAKIMENKARDAKTALFAEQLGLSNQSHSGNLTQVMSLL